jgi:hypothetical protein
VSYKPARSHNTMAAMMIPVRVHVHGISRCSLRTSRRSWTATGARRPGREVQLIDALVLAAPGVVDPVRMILTLTPQTRRICGRRSMRRSSEYSSRR